MHLYALILKPRKGTQPFKYVIAQFRSNMELTLVGDLTVCINTEEINLSRIGIDTY